jgi:NAD-dependent deacetylase
LRRGEHHARMTIPAALIEKLAAATHVAVLTGAGVSAESGVPTFRDAQTGLWANFKPEDLATPAAFRRNPRLVWEWYAWRRERVGSVAPNPAHHALAAMQTRFPRFTLITQNVDGLHQRAGSIEVTELHGNIVRSRCFAGCGMAYEKPEDLPDGEPPCCPACGSWLRPDVVWFGEMLDADKLRAAERACAGANVLFVVGTSGLVYPAAGLPLQARSVGARVIIVNPQPTEIDSVADVLIRGAAGGVLPQILG